ncbi:MAG TPA: hypothetical protein VF798_07000 [Burkholderiaceae bacterium]
MQTTPLTLSWPTKPVTPAVNKTHVAIGVTVSLLLHLSMAAWTWQHRTGSLPFPEKTTIAVRLLPPPAKPAEPVPPPPLPEPAKPQSAMRNVPKSASIVATPARVGKEQSQAPSPAPPATPVPPQEKHLDMNAIYGSVKSTMKDIDRENADTPVGQLAAKPLYPPEDGNRMGRMIDKTTRPDCKEQVQGMGLLAPLGALATLLDKKDNGCKWR